MPSYTNLSSASITLTSAVNEKKFKSYLKDISKNADSRKLIDTAGVDKLFKAVKKLNKSVKNENELKHITLTKNSSKLYFFVSKTKVTQATLSDNEGVVFQHKSSGTPARLPLNSAPKPAPKAPKPSKKLPKKFATMLRTCMKSVKDDLEAMDDLLNNTPSQEQINTSNDELAVLIRRIVGLRKRFNEKKVTDTRVTQRLDRLDELVGQVQRTKKRAVRMLAMRAADAQESTIDDYYDDIGDENIEGVFQGDAFEAVRQEARDIVHQHVQDDYVEEYDSDEESDSDDDDSDEESDSGDDDSDEDSDGDDEDSSDDDDSDEDSSSDWG